ncbi:two-component sensor histidine kinase BarA [Shewanella sp. JM162201]|uniref:histidine kinase n=1 Tax=Shewanella jiangmenensis TaxID=2837387 RepID=A0ABS5UYY9_9GAMM|nr:two-component sensor histidine kinase BarA [Shewanella jiangmenensis]MBT1443384.1 two-component sensor histidine kinase BarA [Shewanella jiangmenensis]
MNTATNMSKYSLRSWVLVLALAPTILVGILLGSYFTINRFYDLEDTLKDMGSNIIEPLAIAAEQSLASNNREVTKLLLAKAQLNKSTLVKSIAVFDANNQLFVTSHYHKDFEEMRFKDDIKNLRETSYDQSGDTLIVRTPIFAIANKPPTANSSYDEVQNRQAEAVVMPDNSDATQLGYVSLMLNKEKALLEQHRAAVAAFIIVLIGVQLNLLFTFRLVKNVTQPITDMVKLVGKIREGKLDARIEGNLIGELDLLNRGINAMASSLSEYHDEMQQNIDQATSDLRETLEQIEIQNIALDRAKKDAQEASRIKSEFLANMSHELRTPLNGVIGFARQLLKTPLHSSQMDYIKTIERSATSLLQIINDILDFSKLEANKMVLESMPFGLRSSLEDTINLLAGSAHAKGLEFVVDVDAAVPENLSGDVMRLTQIMTNLVGNAVKFTEKGSVHLKISLLTREENNITLQCDVTDTGIGIDSEQQELLFQAFGQADSSISRRYGGTGLGLVITKRLVVQMMGGNLGFRSEVGKGSTFWFTVPLQLSPFPAHDTLPYEKLIGHSVLLYEPRKLSRESIARKLHDWHMLVSIAGSEEDLARCLDGRRYDAILLSGHSCESREQLQRMLTQVKDHTHSLMLLNDCLDPEVFTQEMTPYVDLVLPLPLSELKLAQNLIFPPVKKSEQPKPVPVSTPTTRHPLNVLAVDDNLANLKLIDTLLKELVANVVAVSSGDQAVALAKSRAFDLIFMDIQMPGTDGITATKLIRQDSLNRNTPIIAVTAHAIHEERERIQASGMDGYLPKPIDEAALKGVIARWLTRPKFTHFDSNTLNWELCLSQANHKQDLAIDMLKMMLDSLPSTVSDIELAMARSDNEAMLYTVHKLHGASCYCGVPTTQKLCQQIESALKRGADVADVEPEILELLDELTKVESAATQVISQMSAEVPNEF